MKHKITIFFIIVGIFFAPITYSLANDFNVSILPSDSYFSYQWYLNKIKAPEAWDIKRESPNIIIAVIDTGVQIDHLDLKDNIWVNEKEIPANNIDDDNNGYIDDINGWDFVNDDPDPEPKFIGDYTEDGILHGTMVAGVISAYGNNASGISGVTWKSKIMSLKVLDDSGGGDTSKVVKAIDYAIKNGAHIINFSFVGDGFSPNLDRAIKRAYDAGIIIVAAAGNEQGEGSGPNLDKTPLYPVCHDGPGNENRIIGVAATDSLDQKAHFSGYGNNCIDISAPGVSIFSTSVYKPNVQIDKVFLNKHYDGYWSGTSLATPIVSGAAALIKSTNPTLTRREVVDILKNNSDNISKLNPEYVGKLGSGRLNLFNSLIKAKDSLTSKIFYLLASPYSNKKATIKLFSANNSLSEHFEAYAPNFTGGANIATGDINGDNKKEIVVGAGFGGGPHIRIFSSSGELLGQFFAYAPNFRGGVNVAVGDVNGDGYDEIIAGAGNTGGPHVRIFNSRGELLGQFFAYAPNFRGGVNVAVGDVNGDGIAEIVTGAGVGGGPQVRIFNGRGGIQGQFFAFDSNNRHGVKVAVGDTITQDAKNKNEIITSEGRGAKPLIKIFSADGELFKTFMAFGQNFRGGVNLSSGDIDSDGVSEIIAGAGPGGTPHVRIFNSEGSLVSSFFAFNNDFSGGVNVASLITIN